MIFANFGCGGYHSLEHTTWNGLHVADLVFPCFIWIMGACIPMSLTSSLKKGLSNKTIFLNIFKVRSVKKLKTMIHLSLFRDPSNCSA